MVAKRRRQQAVSPTGPTAAPHPREERMSWLVVQAEWELHIGRGRDPDNIKYPKITEIIGVYSTKQNALAVVEERKKGGQEGDQVLAIHTDENVHYRCGPVYSVTVRSVRGKAERTLEAENRWRPPDMHPICYNPWPKPNVTVRSAVSFEHAETIARRELATWLVGWRELAARKKAEAAREKEER